MASNDPKTKRDGWNPKPTPSPFRKIPAPPRVPTFPPPSLSDSLVDDGWEDVPDTLPGDAAEAPASPAPEEAPAPARRIATRPSSPRAIRLDDLKKALEELRERHDEVFPPPSDALPKK